jgi:hypothetical protein
MLIGLESDGTVDFPGVEGLLECHTRREGFTLVAPADELDGGTDYITEYNRVLSRWWEQEQESCE